MRLCLTDRWDWQIWWHEKKGTEGYFLSTIQEGFPPYFEETDSLCSSLSNCIWISGPLFSCKHFCLWNWVRKSGVCSDSLCFYPLLLAFAPIGQGRYDALTAARVIDAKCQSVLLIPTEEAEGWQKIDREDLWMNKTMYASYFSSLGCAVSNRINLETRPLKYDKGWFIVLWLTSCSSRKGFGGNVTGESEKTGQDKQVC